MRRRSLIQIYLLAAMTLAVEVPPGLARSEPQATERCADPAYRDFDFWLGHWRVDNGGLLLQLDGGIEGESMILSGTRTDRDGERVTDRITGTPHEQGKVRQLWESPRDGGETWKTLFEGIYSPAGGDDDEVGEGGGQSGYEIELKTVEPQPTLSVRAPTSVGQIAVTIAERTRMVWRYLRETGATAAGPPFTRYHEIGEEEVDLEVGFPVDEPLEGDGVLEAGELPGGQVIMTVHYGPYEGLDEAGEALNRWLEENGREARGPNWEIYRVNAGSVDDPSRFETDVVKPIR